MMSLRKRSPPTQEAYKQKFPKQSYISKNSVERNKHEGKVCVNENGNRTGMRCFSPRRSTQETHTPKFLKRSSSKENIDRKKEDKQEVKAYDDEDNDEKDMLCINPRNDEIVKPLDQDIPGLKFENAVHLELAKTPDKKYNKLKTHYIDGRAYKIENTDNRKFSKMLKSDAYIGQEQREQQALDRINYLNKKLRADEASRTPNVKSNQQNTRTLPKARRLSPSWSFESYSESEQRTDSVPSLRYFKRAIKLTPGKGKIGYSELCTNNCDDQKAEPNSTVASYLNRMILPKQSAHQCSMKLGIDVDSGEEGEIEELPIGPTFRKRRHSSKHRRRRNKPYRESDVDTRSPDYDDEDQPVENALERQTSPNNRSRRRSCDSRSRSRHRSPKGRSRRRSSESRSRTHQSRSRSRSSEGRPKRKSFEDSVSDDKSVTNRQRSVSLVSQQSFSNPRPSSPPPPPSKETETSMKRPVEPKKMIVKSIKTRTKEIAPPSNYSENNEQNEENPIQRNLKKPNKNINTGLIQAITQTRIDVIEPSDEQAEAFAKVSDILMRSSGSNPPTLQTFAIEDGRALPNMDEDDEELLGMGEDFPRAAQLKRFIVRKDRSSARIWSSTNLEALEASEASEDSKRGRIYVNPDEEGDMDNDTDEGENSSKQYDNVGEETNNNTNERYTVKDGYVADTEWAEGNHSDNVGQQHDANENLGSIKPNDASKEVTWRNKSQNHRLKHIDGKSISSSATEVSEDIKWKRSKRNVLDKGQDNLKNTSKIQQKALIQRKSTTDFENLRQKALSKYSGEKLVAENLKRKVYPIKERSSPSPPGTKHSHKMSSKDRKEEISKPSGDDGNTRVPLFLKSSLNKTMGDGNEIKRQGSVILSSSRSKTVASSPSRSLKDVHVSPALQREHEQQINDTKSTSNSIDILSPSNRSPSIESRNQSAGDYVPKQPSALDLVTVIPKHNAQGDGRSLTLTSPESESKDISLYTIDCDSSDEIEVTVEKSLSRMSCSSNSQTASGNLELISSSPKDSERKKRIVINIKDDDDFEDHGSCIFNKRKPCSHTYHTPCSYSPRKPCCHQEFEETETSKESDEDKESIKSFKEAKKSFKEPIKVSSRLSQIPREVSLNKKLQARNNPDSCRFDRYHPCQHDEDELSEKTDLPIVKEVARRSPKRAPNGFNYVSKALKEMHTTHSPCTFGRWKPCLHEECLGENSTDLKMPGVSRLAHASKAKAEKQDKVICRFNPYKPCFHEGETHQKFKVNKALGRKMSIQLEKQKMRTVELSHSKPVAKSEDVCCKFTPFRPCFCQKLIEDQKESLNNVPQTVSKDGHKFAKGKVIESNSEKDVAIKNKHDAEPHIIIKKKNNKKSTNNKAASELTPPSADGPDLNVRQYSSSNKNRSPVGSGDNENAKGGEDEEDDDHDIEDGTLSVDSSEEKGGKNSTSLISRLSRAWFSSTQAQVAKMAPTQRVMIPPNIRQEPGLSSPTTLEQTQKATDQIEIETRTKSPKAEVIPTITPLVQSSPEMKELPREPEMYEIDEKHLAAPVTTFPTVPLPNTADENTVLQSPTTPNLPKQIPAVQQDHFRGVGVYELSLADSRTHQTYDVDTSQVTIMQEPSAWTSIKTCNDARNVTTNVPKKSPTRALVTKQCGGPSENIEEKPVTQQVWRHGNPMPEDFLVLTSNGCFPAGGDGKDLQIDRAYKKIDTEIEVPSADPILMHFCDKATMAKLKPMDGRHMLKENKQTLYAGRAGITLCNRGNHESRLNFAPNEKNVCSIDSHDQNAIDDAQNIPPMSLRCLNIKPRYPVQNVYFGFNDITGVKTGLSDNRETPMLQLKPQHFQLDNTESRITEASNEGKWEEFTTRGDVSAHPLGQRIYSMPKARELKSDMDQIDELFRRSPKSPRHISRDNMNCETNKQTVKTKNHSLLKPEIRDRKIHVQERSKGITECNHSATKEHQEMVVAAAELASYKSLLNAIEKIGFTGKSQNEMVQTETKSMNGSQNDSSRSGSFSDAVSSNCSSYGDTNSDDSDACSEEEEPDHKDYDNVPTASNPDDDCGIQQNDCEDIGENSSSLFFTTPKSKDYRTGFVDSKDNMRLERGYQPFNLIEVNNKHHHGWLRGSGAFFEGKDDEVDVHSASLTHHRVDFEERYGSDYDVLNQADETNEAQDESDDGDYGEDDEDEMCKEETNAEEEEDEEEEKEGEEEDEDDDEDEEEEAEEEEEEEEGGEEDVNADSSEDSEGESESKDDGDEEDENEEEDKEDVEEDEEEEDAIRY